MQVCALLHILDKLSHKEQGGSSDKADAARFSPSYGKKGEAVTQKI